MLRSLLIVSATARAIRLVTEDDLGYWWIGRPVKRWANRWDRPRWDGGGYVGRVKDEDPDPDLGWRSKLASGIDCMYCVGFWVGVLILIGETLTATKAFRWARPLWTAVLTALALNMATTTVLRATNRL